MNTITARQDKLARIITPILNKVPEITVYFWIIKILCTTIGETAADFLSETLNLPVSIKEIHSGHLLAQRSTNQCRRNIDNG
jgi:uncharacterized membrane-anchored protein